MDIYAIKARSTGRKIFVTLVEVGLIALSIWILFGGGDALVSNWFGWTPATEIPFRRYLIVGFSLISVSRFALMMFKFLHRQVAVAELISVPIAFLLYYVGFAVLVLPHQGALDWRDGLGVVLFVLGSAINTMSEYQRYRFKADQAHKGKLHTTGLFAYAMHINYLGDILWVTGYAVVAHALWGAFIPLILAAFFIFSGIPALDKYLAKRYGTAFEAYAARTKKLVPFIW